MPLNTVERSRSLSGQGGGIAASGLALTPVIGRNYYNALETPEGDTKLETKSTRDEAISLGKC